MSRSVVEKAVCADCGVDVRENTLFCYNCGNRVAEPGPLGGSDEDKRSPTGDDAASDPVDKPDTGFEADDKVKPEAKAALEDLAERIKIEPPLSDDKSIASAAASRKKARGAKKKGREYIWEPVEDPPGRLMLLIVVLITLMAVLAVVITVIWK